DLMTDFFTIRVFPTRHLTFVKVKIGFNLCLSTKATNHARWPFLTVIGAYTHAVDVCAFPLSFWMALAVPCPSRFRTLRFTSIDGLMGTGPPCPGFLAALDNIWFGSTLDFALGKTVLNTVGSDDTIIGV